MKMFVFLFTVSSFALAQYPPYDNGAAMRAQIARDNARMAQQASDERMRIARENARMAQQASDERMRIARENARMAQQASEMRMQIARDNAREQARIEKQNSDIRQQIARQNAQNAKADADFRAQIARENARAMSGQSSYPSGRTYVAPSPSYGAYQTYPVPVFNRTPPSFEEGRFGEYESDADFRPIYPALPPAQSAVQAVIPRQSRGQFFPLDPGVVSVDGRAVPRNARGYYFIGNRPVFDTELAENGAGASAPIADVAPSAPSAPKPTLPTERLESLYGKFANEPGAAFHAYLELIDEAIAPQAPDAPVPVVPEIDKSLLEEVRRSRLASAKAMFDNGTLPDIKTLSNQSVWAGRCVRRSSPKLETGAMLGFLVENNQTYAALVMAASPRDMLASVDAGQPKKYDSLNAEVVNEMKTALAGTVRDNALLRNRPLADRPLAADSLFFDGAALHGANTVGHRLRLFEGPGKKSVLVLETYSPHKEGGTFVDKRVDYLEPIQYCYFTHSVAWQ